MNTLAYYLVELPLGNIENPYTNRPVVLSEFVTLCPSCRSFNSLRQAGKLVHCSECGWKPPATTLALVA